MSSKSQNSTPSERYKNRQIGPSISRSALPFFSVRTEGSLSVNKRNCALLGKPLRVLRQNLRGSSV
jgi:hypothetical protein